jgi:hypothetical protein
MTESPEERSRTDEEFDPAEGVGPPPGDPHEEPGDPEQLPEMVETEVPGPAGYPPDRDPKSDMPRTPSVPETQEDPKSHDAEPSQRREPHANE